MSRPSCHTCPYWMYVGQFSEDEPEGECRRHSPRIIADYVSDCSQEPAEAGIWPWTFAGSFCGEHPGFQRWIDTDFYDELAARSRAIEKDRAASDSPTDPPGRPT